MAYWFFLFFVFFLSLIGFSFLQINFLLVLVIISSLKMKAPLSLFSSFFSGLGFDFVSGRNLGWTSLFFLAISGLIHILNKRFTMSSPVIVFILTFVFYFLFQLIQNLPIKILEVLIISVLAVILSFPKRERIKV